MTKLKPSLPYGQVPLLEYKGTTVTQSVAIARFLAHEFGLGGKTHQIDANIDEVVDAITDFQNTLVININFFHKITRFFIGCCQV